MFSRLINVIHIAPSLIQSSTTANVVLLKVSQTRYFASNASKVGFIGLGNMGFRQATNLIKKGHSLVVFDISKDATTKMKQQGAEVATSPMDVALKAEVIITMLPSNPHVREVYLGTSGLLKNPKKNILFMDCSTIDPMVAREVAIKVKEANCEIVDCPVSGGVGGAEAGTLTFMVGGTKEAFNKAKPYLEAMGKNIVHCGGSGNGQVAKVCNNLVLGISMAAVSEGMRLGTELGMDPKILAGIFNTSSARCWSSDTYNPAPGVMENVPSSRGYTGGFATDLMAKDLGLAIDAGKSIKQALPLTGIAHQLYILSSSRGNGDKDFSIIYQLFGKDKK